MNMRASYLQKKGYLCNSVKREKMKKKLIAKHFATVMVAAILASGATATAQQEIERHFPCPSINIGEKTDHVPNAAYRQKGWDTVVN